MKNFPPTVKDPLQWKTTVVNETMNDLLKLLCELISIELISGNDDKEKIATYRDLLQIVVTFLTNQQAVEGRSPEDTKNGDD